MEQNKNLALKSREIKKIENTSITNDLKKADVKNIVFINLDAKDRKFENCDFSFSTFDNGYFRNAQFINCKFIGSIFVNSNFRNAKFELCKFDYARFSRTHIDVSEVLRNMPSFPNVRRDFLREQRVNADSVGDGDSVRKYLLEELGAEREHWRNAIGGKSDYYSQHYSGFVNQAKARWKSIWLWLDWNIWGHGEAPSKLVISSTVFVVVVTMWAFVTALNYDMSAGDVLNLVGKTLVSVLYAFLGANFEQTSITSFQSLVIRMGHLVFLGLFINLLFRKISRR